MRRFGAVLGGWRLAPDETASFWNVPLPAAAVALVDRYTPRIARGGTVFERPLAPSPEPPLEVAAKTVAALVGSTTIRLMLRPVKALVVSEPVHTAGLHVNVSCGLIGPTSVALVSALSMRYRPTPKKLSLERFA